MRVVGFGLTEPDAGSDQASKRKLFLMKRRMSGLLTGLKSG